MVKEIFHISVILLHLSKVSEFMAMMADMCTWLCTVLASTLRGFGAKESLLMITFKVWRRTCIDLNEIHPKNQQNEVLKDFFP